MENNVLTLIAAPGISLLGSKPLDCNVYETMLYALSRTGANLGEVRWLSLLDALDIPFTGLSINQADAVARRVIDTLPIDVVVQPKANRRKRLLVADMDSTFIAEETLDELAAYVGLKEKIAAITARAMNGEIDFAAALRERVGMLAGLPVEALEQTWQRMSFVGGGRTLVQTMAAAGAHCVLVSGGFRFFTGRVGAACGFAEEVANELEIANGVLTGRVIPPIIDRDAKLDTLKRVAAERNVPLHLAVAVGDGANDLPMLMAAGLGIAFHAQPSVMAVAPYRINHGDLHALLYAQGYETSEFID